MRSLKYSFAFLASFIFLICSVIYMGASNYLQTAQVVDGVPTSGLVSYYSFNNGSVQDEKGGNTLTLTGAPLVEDGRVGKALNFSGTNQYAEINNSIVTSYPFSISAWAKGSGTIAALADKDASVPFYYIKLSGGQGSIVARDDNGAESLVSGSGSGSGWHHIVGVFNSAKDRKLYMDGSLKASDTVDKVFNTAVDRFSIGRVGKVSASGYFSGLIDEVAVYSKALSAAEVTTIYESVPNIVIVEDPQIDPNTDPQNNTGCSSISQDGITWTFDKSYPCGKFANGDNWIVGPAVITSITPAFTGTFNGWEVNPGRTRQHGLHAQIEDFNPSLVPALPYAAQPNQSIVKTISLNPGNSTCKPDESSQAAFKCIDRASVLTVLGSVPPDDGATVFRPPFVGSDKVMYSVGDLRTNLLPNLAKPSSYQSLDWIRDRFSKVQLDFLYGRAGRSMRPQQNYQGDSYGPDVSNSNIEGALGLMLNDSQSAKRQALINYVQAGIDALYELKYGRNWNGGGAGVEPGFMITPAFAAVILDKPDLKDLVRAKNHTFMENDYTKSMKVDSEKGLYGSQDRFWSEYKYWEYLVKNNVGGTISASADKDPYGFIDGEIPKTNSYQYCCTFGQWKGEALAAQLMPELKSLWTTNKFFNYVDRYNSSGIKTAPDPCAPATLTMSDYGRKFGPDPRNPGMCILDPDLAYYNSPSDFACKAGLQCGRYPELNGRNKGAHGYPSAFTNSMWTKYYIPGGGGGETQEDTTPPSISAVNATAITSTGATINWVTNEPTSNQVEYGPTTSYGSITSSVSSNSQQLNTLTPSTLYHYRVKSKDVAGNSSVSGDNTFTTSANIVDSIAPIISAITATNITQTTATIRWTTNEVSDSQVDYGNLSTSISTPMVLNHSVTITGLTANTLYHYRVKSKDTAGNISAPNDNTFTTLDIDEVPPTTYTISISKTGDGIGVVSGNGIYCGSDCNEIVTEGTVVTLSADPRNNSKFTGWSGACSGTGTCTLTIAGDTSVVANFDKSYEVIAGMCGTVVNSCIQGSFSDTVDSVYNHLWSCVGNNGGANMSCSLDKAITPVVEAPIIPANLPYTPTILPSIARVIPSFIKTNKTIIENPILRVKTSFGVFPKGLISAIDSSGEIKAVQLFLSSYPGIQTFVVSKNNLSTLVSGKYDKYTKDAVQRFQLSQGLYKPGQKNYGVLDNITKNRITDLLKDND